MFRTLSLALAGAALALAFAPEAHAQFSAEQYKSMEKQGYGEVADYMKGMTPAQQKELSARADKMEQKLNNMTPEQREYYNALAKEKLSRANINQLSRNDARRRPSATRTMGTNTSRRGEPCEGDAAAAAPENPEQNDSATMNGEDESLTTPRQRQKKQAGNGLGHLNEAGQWVPAGVEEETERKKKAATGFRDGSVPMRSNKASDNKNKVNIIN